MFVNSLGGGGAERAMANLSLALTDKAHFKFVLLKDRVDYEFKGKIEVLNFNREGSGFLSSIHRFYSTIKQIKKVYNKYSPDIVLSSLGYFNFIVSLFVKENIPVIQNIISVYRGVNLRSILRYRLINYFSKKIIAASKGVKDDLIKNFGFQKRKINVIYNSINGKKIKRSAKEEIKNDKINQWTENGDTTTLINVASLTPQKGHYFLLKSFKLAVKKNSSLRLVLLGKGRLEKSLKNLSESLNIEDKVLFCGFKKNPFKFVSRSDIFLLSSLYEGFGNVLIEAMACGVPVVSADCRYGPREIIAPNTNFKKKAKKPEFEEYGILMPTFNKDAQTEKENSYNIKVWSKVINYFCKNEQLKKRYEKKGKKRANDFDISSLRDDWVKILK